MGEQRMEDYLTETEHDRCIRKFSMINLLIVFVLYCGYILFAAVGFGYYTFHNFDKAHCYADANTTIPKSTRSNDDEDNVTEMIYVGC